jgi:Na+/melibiose symporter-like transporter
MPLEKSKDSKFALIVILGLGLGFSSTMLFNIFPDRLAASLEIWLGNDGNIMVALILLLSAAISLPMSTFVYRMGLRKSFWWSLFIAVVCVFGVMFVSVPFITLLFALLFAVVFTSMSVSALPLVLKESSFTEKVFCVGVFYSAMALPDGIVETALAYLSSIGI